MTNMKIKRIIKQAIFDQFLLPVCKGYSVNTIVYDFISVDIHC